MSAWDGLERFLDNIGVAILEGLQWMKARLTVPRQERASWAEYPVQMQLPGIADPRGRQLGRGAEARRFRRVAT